MEKNVDGIHMVWVVVSDLKKAVKFYTEVLGLILLELSDEYGWAELSGPSGCRLGLAQYNEKSEEFDDSVNVGKNAVVAITVKDLEAEKNAYLQKGVRLVGKVLEVPGHVKMQTFKDTDGNTFQLAQMLSATHP